MTRKDRTPLVAAALLTFGLVLYSTSAVAEQTAITSEDKKLMGGCASLGFKIIQNGKQFAPEFRQLGNNLLFMPAVIEPPPKDDPHFIEGRDSMIEALGSTPPSDRSPIYLQHINRCVDWVNRFTNDQKPNSGK